MPAVHSAKKGEGLRAAKLAEKNSVRAKSQGRRQEGVGIHPGLAHLASHRDQADAVGVIETDLSGVLDRDEALGGVDLLDQGVQKRGLAAAGAPRDHDGLAATNRLAERTEGIPAVQKRGQTGFGLLFQI